MNNEPLKVTDSLYMRDLAVIEPTQIQAHTHLNKFLEANKDLQLKSDITQEGLFNNFPMVVLPQLFNRESLVELQKAVKNTSSIKSLKISCQYRKMHDNLYYPWAIVTITHLYNHNIKLLGPIYIKRSQYNYSRRTSF